MEQRALRGTGACERRLGHLSLVHFSLMLVQTSRPGFTQGNFGPAGGASLESVSPSRDSVVPSVKQHRHLLSCSRHDTMFAVTFTCEAVESLPQVDFNFEAMRGVGETLS